MSILAESFALGRTAVLIGMAAALRTLVHRVDLDGDRLIGEDPFESSEHGPDFSGRLPGRPGLGIRERI